MFKVIRLANDKTPEVASRRWAQRWLIEQVEVISGPGSSVAMLLEKMLECLQDPCFPTGPALGSMLCKACKPD
jgi:hypothetical protein